MDKKKLYIHVGYPKTATSTLQKNIFPKLEGVNYLGRIYCPSENINNNIIEKIIEGTMSDILEFKQSKEFDCFTSSFKDINLINRFHKNNMKVSENFHLSLEKFGY